MARKEILDASLIPLEKALLARAEALEKFEPLATQASARWLAAEFRALAEELHRQ